MHLLEHWLSASFSDAFDDISTDAYYYNEIGSKQLGITLGTGNNKFEPDLGTAGYDDFGRKNTGIA